MVVFGLWFVTTRFGFVIAFSCGFVFLFGFGCGVGWLCGHLCCGHVGFGWLEL